MKKYYEEILVNAKVIEMNRICDLIRIVFLTTTGITIHLHATCFVRMFDSNGALCLSTSNLLLKSVNYKKKWYKKYDWSQVGATCFDDELEENKSQVLSTTVCSFKFEHDDIKILFANQMRIDVKVAVTKHSQDDYHENYRLFRKNSTEKYLVI